MKQDIYLNRYSCFNINRKKNILSNDKENISNTFAGVSVVKANLFMLRVYIRKYVIFYVFKNPGTGLFSPKTLWVPWHVNYIYFCNINDTCQILCLYMFVLRMLVLFIFCSPLASQPLWKSTRDIFQIDKK